MTFHSRYLSAKQNAKPFIGQPDGWSVIALGLQSMLVMMVMVVGMICSSAVYAIPNSGNLFEQVPELPEEKEKPLQLQVEQDLTAINEAANPGGTMIPVKSLKITDATSFTEKELFAVVAYQGPGKYSLKDLRSYAAKITEFYHQKGFLLAHAYLPAQDIVNGVVKITVMEGRYGVVKLRNETGFADALFTEVLYGLKSGDPVSADSLESRLLLLSDIPGVNVKTKVIPGKNPGTSDVMITASPGALINGNLTIDNAGDSYSGRLRPTPTLNINNPTGHGDVITLRAQSTFNGVNYGRAAYQIQSNRLKLGASIAKINDSLSDGTSGNGTVTSAFGSYALIRSTHQNLYLKLAYDSKILRDTGSENRIDMITATLSGDKRDEIMGKEGTSSFMLALASGRLNIVVDPGTSDNAMSANGRFSRLGFNVARLQTINEQSKLYLSIRGQSSSRNLEISEKFSLGGANGVRAYPQGEAYGDVGYIVTAEFRRKVGEGLDLPGEFQAIGFLDTGMDFLYKSPVTSVENRRTLSGIGLGIDWTDGEDLSLRASYAHTVGGGATTAGTKTLGGQFWIQGSQNF